MKRRLWTIALLVVLILAGSLAGEAPERPAGTETSGATIYVNTPQDELYADGVIQISKLKAIGRLGGGIGNDMYCRISDSFVMVRPT